MAVISQIFPSPRSTLGQEIVVANDAAYATALGQVSGIASTFIHGANPSAPNGTQVDIWPNGGTLTWPQAATQMDVVSSSVNDDGNPTTSTGAQTVVIEGLNSSFAEISETVTLNGTTLVTTTASFLRINSMYVATSGTYHGSNAGTITARVTGGGAVQATIAIGLGQSQKSHYTVPAGKTALWVRSAASVDSTKSARITFWQYQNADDVTQPYGGGARIVHRSQGLSGTNNIVLRAFPPAFPAKTDLWWTVTATAAATPVSVNYDLLITTS